MDNYITANEKLRVFRVVIDLLYHGWTKDRSEWVAALLPPHGPVWAYDLIGALERALEIQRVKVDVDTFLQYLHLPDRWAAYAFNDAPETQLSDVIGLICAVDRRLINPLESTP